jgi:hypothetical protein
MTKPESTKNTMTALWESSPKTESAVPPNSGLERCARKTMSAADVLVRSRNADKSLFLSLTEGTDRGHAGARRGTAALI